MSSSRRWEDREDKTIEGRQSISISRDLLSSLSSLSSHEITLVYARGFSSFREKIIFPFSTLNQCVLWEDREDREDKQPVGSVFLSIRWEDRFRALNHKNRSEHIGFSCLPSVFPHNGVNLGRD